MVKIRAHGSPGCRRLPLSRLGKATRAVFSIARTAPTMTKSRCRWSWIVRFSIVSFIVLSSSLLFLLNDTALRFSSKRLEEIIINEMIENRTLESILNQTSHDHRHLVFVMVGAVRAIEKTAFVTMQNLVTPLCPPSTCIPHLVTHLSYSDNRPDEGGRGDPKGRSIALEETTIQRI